MLLERKAQGEYAIAQGQKDRMKEYGKIHGVVKEIVTPVKNMMNAKRNTRFHLVTELGAGMDGEIQDVRPHQVDMVINIIRVVIREALISPTLFLLDDFLFQSIRS